jgi:hypothetical protein
MKELMYLKDWGILTIKILLLIILYATVSIIDHNYFSEKECKNYIIEHKDELRTDNWSDNEWINFKLDSCDNIYYTDVTVRIKKDSSYNVIFWGDRDSWRWRFKLDKFFTIDIPYNRYKDKNIELDIKLYDIINKIKQ